jgi:hypothetical protein
MFGRQGRLLLQGKVLYLLVGRPSGEETVNQTTNRVPLLERRTTEETLTILFSICRERLLQSAAAMLTIGLHARPKARQNKDWNWGYK